MMVREPHVHSRLARPARSVARMGPAKTIQCRSVKEARGLLPLPIREVVITGIPGDGCPSGPTTMSP